jgi:hypothetical protein
MDLVVAEVNRRCSLIVEVAAEPQYQGWLSSCIRHGRRGRRLVSVGGKHDEK